METQLWDRCRRSLAGLPRDARFSHVTSAALHGLPVPAAHRERLHLTVGRGVYVAGAGRFVVHQRLVEGPPQRLSGVPLCGLVESWFDAAGQLAEDDAVAAGDAAARLVGREALVAYCEARAGFRGSLRVMRVLARVRGEDPGDDVVAAAASRVRLVAARAGLPAPRLGLDIGGRTGRVELAWPEVGLAVLAVGREAGDAGEPEMRIDGPWRVLRVPAVPPRDGAADLGSRLRLAYVGTW